MKRWILIMTLMVLTMMSSLATATEICEDTIQSNTLCYLVTPVVTGCTNYTYSIYNNTGGLVQSGNLTDYDGGSIDIYYMNFSQPEGSYLVKLCDDTTRELYVGVGGLNEVKGSMGWTGILLALLGMIAVLGMSSYIIKDDKLMFVKRAFFVMFVVNGLMLGIVSFIISVNPYNAKSFYNLGLGYAFVNIILILGFLWNYAFVTVARIYKRSKDRWVDIFKSKEKRW